MQISDNFITALRSFRRDINGCANTKMSTLTIPASHNCKNASFLDKGYYRRHNADICFCKDGQEQDADFRSLECEICHQEILLLNTGIPNWDFIPNIVNKNDLEHTACKK